MAGSGVAVPGKLGAFVAWPYRAPFAIERTQILRRANFKVMEDDACKMALAGTNLTVDTQTEFCTTTESGQLTGDVAACDGNLGSPLLIGPQGNEDLLGILVGFNRPCNARDRPTGIFARVDQYRQWIEAITSQP